MNLLIIITIAVAVVNTVAVLGIIYALIKGKHTRTIDINSLYRKLLLPSPHISSAVGNPIGLENYSSIDSSDDDNTENAVSEIVRYSEQESLEKFGQAFLPRLPHMSQPRIEQELGHQD